MKKFTETVLKLLVFSTVCCVVFWYSSKIHDELSAPCTIPTTYKLGDIDPRFDIKTETVLEELRKAEALWEDDLNRDLFHYDENSMLTVSLVFDERQGSTIAAQEQGHAIDMQNEKHAEMGTVVESYRAKVSTAELLYKKSEQEYSDDLAKYNKKIKKINESGGADKDDRKDLDDERDDFEERLKNLKREFDRLNELVVQGQKAVAAYNDFGNEINEDVTEFNEEYSAPREFHQGVFNGREIVIFQYDSLLSLRLVLAHELGHARGLGHVDDGDAVMSAISSGQDLQKLVLAESDVIELRTACNPTVTLESWLHWFNVKALSVRESLDRSS